MTSEEEIKKRLYNCPGFSSLPLIEFLSISKIRFDNPEVNSAAVSCGVRPVLNLNPDFLAQHCQSDEHLFMLIMHEMFHLILGHTNLFERDSLIDNICFDAVINATLCQIYRDSRYTSFFKNLYRDDRFPELLLRPKGPNTPARYWRTLDQLYGSNTFTYYEIYQLLQKNFKERWNHLFIRSSYSPESGSNGNLDDPDSSIQIPILLGNHQHREDFSNAGAIKSFISQYTRDWILTGDGKVAGLFADLKEVTAELSAPDRVNRLKIRRMIERFSYDSLIGQDRSLRMSRVTSNSFTYSMSDRRAAAKLDLLQGSIPSFESQTRQLSLDSDDPQKTLVYLDVSGSAADQLGEIFPLLLDLLKRRRIELYSFSIEVRKLSYRDLEEGRYKTDMGTDIEPVFKHYLSSNLHRLTDRFLLITDEWFNPLSPEISAQCRARHTKVGLILTREHNPSQILGDIITRTEVLR